MYCLIALAADLWISESDQDDQVKLLILND